MVSVSVVDAVAILVWVPVKSTVAVMVTTPVCIEIADLLDDPPLKSTNKGELGGHEIRRDTREDHCRDGRRGEGVQGIRPILARCPAQFQTDFTVVTGGGFYHLTQSAWKVLGEFQIDYAKCSGTRGGDRAVVSRGETACARARKKL